MNLNVSLCFVKCVATVNRVGSSMTVSSLSNQMKEMRSTAMLDERSSLMLDALRGKNINDDDKQGLGVDMKLVEVRGRDSNDVDDVLPTTYDTIELDKYFNKRPLDQVTRVWQVLSASASYISGVLLDYATGNTANIEVRRAAELRNTIVSLGPFFIKIGRRRVRTSTVLFHMLYSDVSEKARSCFVS